MRRALLIVAGIAVIALGLVELQGGVGELLSSLGIGGDGEVKAAAQKAAKADRKSVV